MLTLSKASKRNGRAGKPLPDTFKSFTDAKVYFRTGETSMIAGVPGSYKSVLGLNMAALWSLSGLLVYYFSADSQEATVQRRLGSILTGDDYETADRNLRQNAGFYDSQLKRLDNITWEYDRLTSTEEIKDHLEAFELVNGVYPDVVFLDNLCNFTGRFDDWPGMLELVNQMDATARKMKTHVCILHHAKIKEPLRNQDAAAQVKTQGWPPRDDEIQGKITQLSRLVLTVAAVDRNVYWCPVKNSNGPQDPKAQRRYGFYVRDSLRIWDTGRSEMADV